ncbi:GNAT family N-acetyltransferase [Tenacibaculum sp. 190524A02b]|uniref:GNAT family N-acetyltransferase n=1 Tax=Tenacibaculum vairaonense TaxID=3137860 RepID=UPI0031FB151B
MIRAYSTTDKSQLIEILRKNIPDFFDYSEEKDFKNYLDNELEDYFVYEENGKIIGSGGINYYTHEKTARISWDIIDPKTQGKGIGKKLTQFRINHINNNIEIDKIIVRTSQLAYKFYEKMGFQLVSIEKDFWAKDFDLYLMEMKNNSI